MTAQVIIMNRRAIAVASDSSLTVSSNGQDQRTFSGARKVFPLPAPHRIVTLHSGLASINRVPYDVLLGEWAAALGDKPLASVESYVEHLLDWLPQQRVFEPHRQWLEFRDELKAVLLDARASLVRRLNEAEVLPEQNGSDAAVSIAEASAEESLRVLMTWSAVAGCDLQSSREYIEQRSEGVAELVEWVFDDTPRSPRFDEIIARIVEEFGYRWNWVANGDRSAVLAVAGYGNEEVFPSSQLVTLDSIWNERVRHRLSGTSTIDVDNDSLIQPLGLSEAMWTFFSGYDDSFGEVAEARLRKFSNDLFGDMEDDPEFAEQVRSQTSDAVEALHDEFAQWSQQRFIDPLTATVAAMPESHLAGVAASFVELQVLRQRTHAQMETVGGEIACGLINRSEGFRWVDRATV